MPVMAVISLGAGCISGCDIPIQMLGTKLRPLARAVCTLTTEPWLQPQLLYLLMDKEAEAQKSDTGIELISERDKVQC